eukprot:1158396-Pelagomonas_calceolata.AAC.5
MSVEATTGSYKASNASNKGQGLNDAIPMGGKSKIGCPAAYRVHGALDFLQFLLWESLAAIATVVSGALYKTKKHTNACLVEEMAAGIVVAGNSVAAEVQDVPDRSFVNVGIALCDPCSWFVEWHALCAGASSAPAPSRHV